MNKNLLLILFSSVIVTCFSQTPDTVISQTDIGANWYSGSTLGGGQSFTIENEGKLTGFRFYTLMAEGPTVVQLRVGQNVEGTLLYTDTIDVNGQGWFTASFPEIDVCPGVYCVLLSDFQYGALNVNNPYTGGMAIFSGNWQSSLDMAFEVIQIVNSVAPIADAAVLEDYVSACPVEIYDLPVPSATDNCSDTVFVTNNAVFPIAADTTVITWTYSDGNGGISTQTQRIIIPADTIAPEFDPIDDYISTCILTEIEQPYAYDCSEVTVTSDAVFPITADTTVVTWTFTDMNGNSSFAEQKIIILPFGLSVDVEGNILTATIDDEDAEFQWLDCSNGFSALEDQSEDNFDFTGMTGSFAVGVYSYGCVDTSSCFSVGFASLEKNGALSPEAYPNPVSSNLTVEAAEIISSIILSDMQGRIIRSEAVGSNILNTDLSALKEGSYIIQIITESGKTFSQKIEKI